jgi:dTDP-4-amino-4,6-dideoxygalactose transaminase
MKTLIPNSNTKVTEINCDKLAIDGGSKAIKAAPPATLLHGTAEIGEEEIAAVTKALKSKNLFRFHKDPANSPTAQFEELFKTKSKAKFALAVNSGTSALIAGLVGLGISSGDEVLVPAYTYIASAAAVLAVRAIPVIVEVDQSLTLDPEDIVKKITSRTKAILPVHMRGVPCQMDQIISIAREHKLKVLEDCAQANGGSYRGQALGTLGDAGAFSLQHYKIMTAGEGGLLTTNNRTVFDRAACYHDSAYAFWKEGEKSLSIDAFLGENYRMSDLNGALAFEQLKKRDPLIERLRWIKKQFKSSLEKIAGITLQSIPDETGDCSTSIVFYVKDSDHAKRFAKALSAEGLSAGGMFDKSIPDRHVYPNWTYILEKRTPDAYGYPWNDPSRPCNISYSKEMCPRTLELLSKAVVIPIGQQMSDEYVKEASEALIKVGKLVNPI